MFGHRQIEKGDAVARFKTVVFHFKRTPINTGGTQNFQAGGQCEIVSAVLLYPRIKRHYDICTIRKGAGTERIGPLQIADIFPVGKHPHQMGVSTHGTHGGVLGIHHSEIDVSFVIILIFEGEVACQSERPHFHRFPDNFHRAVDIVRLRCPVSAARPRLAALGKPQGNSGAFRGKFQFDRAKRSEFQFQLVGIGVSVITDNIGILQKPIAHKGVVVAGSRPGYGNDTAHHLHIQSRIGEGAGDGFGKRGDIFRRKEVAEAVIRLIPYLQRLKGFSPMRNDIHETVSGNKLIRRIGVYFRAMRLKSSPCSSPGGSIVEGIQRADPLFGGKFAVEAVALTEVELALLFFDLRPG